MADVMNTGGNVDKNGMHQSASMLGSGKVDGPDSKHDIRDNKLKPNVGPRPIHAHMIPPAVPKGRGNHNPSIMGG